MERIEKNILIMFLAVAILFSFSLAAGSALAAENPITTIQQKIQSLIQQITDLFKQLALQIQASPENNQLQIQSQSSSSGTGSGTATLTVNASGVTAYVSINGGAQFAYTNPINLNNGDTYSVTATSTSNGGNSTTKCNGTASSGGSYTCNITVNQ